MSTEAYLQLFSNQQAEAAPMNGGAAQAPQDGAGAGSQAQGSPPAGSPHGSPAGTIQTPEAAHQHHDAQPPPTRPAVNRRSTPWHSDLENLWPGTVRWCTQAAQHALVM